MRRIALLLLTLLACALGSAAAQEARGGAGETPPCLLPESERPSLFDGICGPAEPVETEEREYTGRWGVRLEYPLEATAYAEVALAQFAGIEIGAGVEVRYESGDPFTVTPYTVFALYREAYWIALEFAASLGLANDAQHGFAAALAYGGRF